MHTKPGAIDIMKSEHGCFAPARLSALALALLLAACGSAQSETAPKEVAVNPASSPAKWGEENGSTTNKYGDSASGDGAAGSDDISASSEPSAEQDQPFADHPNITREQIEAADRNRE
jgi:hypothetical protein